MKNIENKLFPLLVKIGIDDRMIPQEAYLMEDVGIKRQELAWLLFRLEIDFGIEVPVKNWQKGLSLRKIKNFLSEKYHSIN
jgi:hypothetical protein